MQQLGLFDSLRRPAVVIDVDRDGPVVRGDVDAVYRLPHPRMAWDYGRIEIHQHENGLWMWSASWTADQAGNGYRVGAKWGRFAETKADALFYAASEIEERLSTSHGRETNLVKEWARTIKDNPEGAKPN